MNPELTLLLQEHGGLLEAAGNRPLRGKIARACAARELHRMLPGVYCLGAPAPQHEKTTTRELLTLRARAVRRWDPDAVVLGEAAAALSFWPELSPAAVDVASRRKPAPAAGFRFRRLGLPPELVLERDGLRLAAPAWVALQLTTEHGADVIDRVLRTRAATLAELHEVLRHCPRQRGNRQRQVWLTDSRDEPWSAAERLLHRLLRGADVDGWRSNHPVLVAGQRYHLDVAFPDCRLVVEVDGREFHSSAAVFESDRERQNALVRAGWTVLRITWAMLEEQPEEVIALITEVRVACQQRRS